MGRRHEEAKPICRKHKGCGRSGWRESLGSVGVSTLGVGRGSWGLWPSEGTPNANSILTYRTENRCNMIEFLHMKYLST